MRPLLFLTGKFLVNSVRRAMHSPSRLIGFLLLVGWWFLIVTGRLSDRQPGPAIPGGVQLDMPREAVVFSLLFPVYLMVFVMRGFSMFRVPGIFRGADSDVLFPTPIAPWKVLLHRFVIDYLITLLIPLLMLLFAGPGASRGIEFLFKNIPNPDAARWVSKLIFLAFLLVSLFGVAFSYAVALYINRDTDLARRVRRLVMGLVIALILALGAAIALAALSEKPGTALVELASHPLSYAPSRIQRPQQRTSRSAPSTRTFGLHTSASRSLRADRFSACGSPQNRRTIFTTWPRASWQQVSIGRRRALAITERSPY